MNDHDLSAAADAAASAMGVGLILATAVVLVLLFFAPLLCWSVLRQIRQQLAELKTIALRHGDDGAARRPCPACGNVLVLLPTVKQIRCAVCHSDVQVK